jgi:uncharacterized protein YdeI (YjbR/CyaY-like superfamily)
MEVEIETFCPASPQEWREWLERNHETKQAVWLIYFKKIAKKPTLTWSQAVDEALCFGWIDSTAQTIDAESYRQFFTKRKAKSVWSKINKEKVKVLLAANKITKAGLESIEVAKRNGSWTILDEVEEMIIPSDLELAFAENFGSKDFFLSITKSTRKAILQWLVLAKQPETRAKRIQEIVANALNKTKPKQF